MNKLRLIALFTTIAMSVAMMVSCGDVKDKNKDSADENQTASTVEAGGDKNTTGNSKTEADADKADGKSDGKDAEQDKNNDNVNLDESMTVSIQIIDEPIDIEALEEQQKQANNNSGNGNDNTGNNGDSASTEMNSVEPNMELGWGPLLG